MNCRFCFFAAQWEKVELLPEVVAENNDNGKFCKYNEIYLKPEEIYNILWLEDIRKCNLSNKSQTVAKRR